MKAEHFLEALGEVNDKYIEEARYIKMKKRFNFKPIIAAAACAVFALAAIPVAQHFATPPAVQGTQMEKIGVNGNFTAYEMGTHSGNNALKAEHKTEMTINTGGEKIVIKEKEGTKKTIEFNGKKWTGTYLRTKTSDYYGDDNDWYRGEDCTFTINTKTGICTYFQTSFDEDTENNKEYSQDECYDIAVEYLSGFVDDVEAYELKYVVEKEWQNGYYFMIYRTIDGIATSDRVSIGVRKTGEVYTHVFHSLGEMKNVDISGLDMEKLNKIIDKKVKDIYKSGYDLTHETEHMELVKLADGSFAFDCTIKVEGKNTPDGEVATDTCFIGITVE